MEVDKVGEPSDETAEEVCNSSERDLQLEE